MSTSGGMRSVVLAVRGNGGVLAVSGEGIAFRPVHVKLINETTGAEAEWFATMADDSMFKRLTGGVSSTVTADGVTPLANGFQLGADSDLNNDDDLIHVRADG